MIGRARPELDWWFFIGSGGEGFCVSGNLACFCQLGSYLLLQVDWENLVGVTVSVSITGAFRFSGVDGF